MGQGGRAQQRHKHQAEGEKTFTDRTHAKNLARAAAFPIRCTLVAMPILRARLLCNQAPLSAYRRMLVPTADRCGMSGMRKSAEINETKIELPL
jgi:hypothetical protein